jgi:penicillin-binding protein 1A
MTKPKQNPKNNKSQDYKDIIQLMWIFALTLFLGISAVFIFISKMLLPDTEDLENPKYEIASQILSDDGTEIGKAFTINREWTLYNDLNPKIIQALVATEDERFFSHCGVDTKSTLRAILFLGKKGGASTITQQLAKQFFTQRSASFFKRSWQKLKEWVIAVEFEKRYTKEEILAMYLNKFDFWYGANGIGAAAKTYFGKSQADLNAGEAAVLIGMLKNPYYYNPVINPENVMRRRSVVLNQMVKNKYITKDEMRVHNSKPLDMSKFKREVYNDGIAPYFRSEVTKVVREILEDTRYRKPDGSKYNIFTDGLRIYTTIDVKMQKHAEAAMQEHMSGQQKRYFEVWKNKDPWSSNLSAAQKAQRQANLQEKIRQTDRFKLLRGKYLTEVSSKIFEDVPNARLLDVDIFRLYDIEANPKAGEKMVKDQLISSEMLTIYQDVLQNEHWPKLKIQWEALKTQANKSFERKVNMMIYDYTTGKEKKVVMSPLDSIKYVQQHLQIGSVGVDPKTGEVKFWVGGINHKYFQYDHVRSTRQVGSTFKPFIYATAIVEQAMSPCQKVQDVMYCIKKGDADFGLMKDWCPNNADNKFTGLSYTLREALKESKNSVSVYLMKELGNVETVRSFVERLRVPLDKIPKSPSICLGVGELSAFDMASAYTTFANGGVQSNPFFITRIEDKNGKIIYTAVPEQKKAINPNDNFVIVDMLKFAADPIAGKLKSPVAGKTGTTNDYKDGWFVGFTPNIVIATWVGGDVEWIRFTNIVDGQGSRMARPFFVSVLERIEKDNTLKFDLTKGFEIPEGDLVETDCSKYETIIKEGTRSEDFDDF